MSWNGLRTHKTNKKPAIPRAMYPIGTVSNPVLAELNWWSQAGSNRRPLQCHCSALPIELWPHSSARVGMYAPSFSLSRSTKLTGNTGVNRSAIYPSPGKGQNSRPGQAGTNERSDPRRTRRNTKKKKKECPRNSRKTRKKSDFSVFSVSSVDTLSFSSSCSFVSFVDRSFLDRFFVSFVDRDLHQ